ncbi:hypothetical protein ACVHNB_20005 [Streptomyces sp. YJ-C3]
MVAGDNGAPADATVPGTVRAGKSFRFTVVTCDNTAEPDQWRMTVATVSLDVANAYISAPLIKTEVHAHCRTVADQAHSAASNVAESTSPTERSFLPVRWTRLKGAREAQGHTAIDPAAVSLKPQAST